MTNLLQFSNALADLVASAEPSIVQVLGARRPATGVVHGPDTIVTMARALGREDGLRIRLPGSDPEGVQSNLAGWDPATGLAVLRTATAIDVAPPRTAEDEPRTGAVVVAIARSWSNAVTASAGNVAVVGGPLRTGRRRQIGRVFRITAPIHDGFAGAGIFDASGRLTGIATASAIRGFAVGIPASIAWAAAARVLEHGTPQRGFIGVVVQPVALPASLQRAGRERALLVTGVSPSSPAERAGVMVGDLLLEFDGQSTAAAEDLLDLLTNKKVGQEVGARLLRGGVEQTVQITVVERTRD